MGNNETTDPEVDLAITVLEAIEIILKKEAMTQATRLGIARLWIGVEKIQISEGITSERYRKILQKIKEVHPLLGEDDKFTIDTIKAEDRLRAAEIALENGDRPEGIYQIRKALFLIAYFQNHEEESKKIKAEIERLMRKYKFSDEEKCKVNL